MFTLPFIPEDDLAAALRLLERGCATTSPDGMQVLVQGSSIHFPFRVYYAREDVLEACRTPGMISKVALCVGTRHHDGFVREACLRALLPVEDAWVVPFVLQLLGEYVVEIADCIESALAGAIPARYVDFTQENPAYMHRLRQQATSYWNVYYRRAYPTRNAYPALRLLERLGEVAA